MTNKNSDFFDSHTDLVGIVRCKVSGKATVLIDGTVVSLKKRDMQRVFPGDKIRLGDIFESREGQLIGRIETVLERHTSKIVGQYHSEYTQRYVVPSDKRILHQILIDSAQSIAAEDGDIVEVEILEQPSDYSQPLGKLTEVLGTESDAGMEVKIALSSFAIPHEWPEPVILESSILGDTVQEADKQNRNDLRNLPFVTIDGADAKDFDDAVYAKKTKTGWQLKVAIADVSAYVHPNSALDKEALERGTSVYFPRAVIPMLPESLSNGLCSLKPKVDRLALVCSIQINQDGEVEQFDFCEAVIRSHARLTYRQVNDYLQQGIKSVNGITRDLAEPIDCLYSLYQQLMQARIKRGALEFDSSEVQFIFDDLGKIESVEPLVRNDAHRLIEECMLCANICAAGFLESNELDGLYRVHMAPAAERLETLRDYLLNLGIQFGGGDSPQPECFRHLAEIIATRDDRSVIEMMILRSQQQAVYQPENHGHFGLAYPAYAHFTSPIRRYPDLLMHRAIHAVIRSDKKFKHVERHEGRNVEPFESNYPYKLSDLEQLGAHCSSTERRAEEASRDVIQWLKCHYLKNRLGDEFSAVVAAVTDFGMFVRLDETSMEGLLHIANLPRDYYEFIREKQHLKGRKTDRVFAMGQALRVQVVRVDLDQRKVDLGLVESAGSNRGKRDIIQASKQSKGCSTQPKISRALDNRKNNKRK